MKTIFSSLAILGLASLLAGCQTLHRDDVGLIGGGVAGGYIGNAVTGGSTLGTIGGAIGGAYLGREVARRTR